MEETEKTKQGSKSENNTSNSILNIKSNRQITPIKKAGEYYRSKRFNLYCAKFNKFIFMRLNNKNIDISIFTVWCLFVSFLVKSFYSNLHSFILSDIKINDSLKVVVFSITGLLLALLCNY